MIKDLSEGWMVPRLSRRTSSASMAAPITLPSSLQDGAPVQPGPRVDRVDTSARVAPRDTVGTSFRITLRTVWPRRGRIRTPEAGLGHRTGS